MVLTIILVVVWMVVSQMIAWWITPSKDKDEVLSNWFRVFLAPAVLPLAVLIGWRK